MARHGHRPPAALGPLRLLSLVRSPHSRDDVLDTVTTSAAQTSPPADVEPNPGVGSRVVDLQNSSDSVVWREPELLWRLPDFLDDPRAPDVSPKMTWIRVFPLWQTSLDLPLSSGAPQGHGHRYGRNVVDAWAADLQPDGWTPSDTASLRDQIDEG